MKPETANYLDKAREDLRDAQTIAAVGLAKVAARSAYYAGFHAAEAILSEYTGKIAKTHSGVRTELARLAITTLAIDKTFPAFLAKTYKYKEVSDYSIGPDAVITVDEARDAIENAVRFVELVTALLTDEPSKDKP